MKKLIDILKFAVFTALALALLYFAFSGVDINMLIDNLKTANYWWVLLSLFFALIAYISRAYRWKLLIEPLGYTPKPSSSFYSLMVGYLANLAFPRIGEVTRCATLKKAEKIPFDKLVGTVILERVFDMIILIGLIIIVFSAKIDFFGKFMMDNVFNPLLSKFSFFAHLSVFFMVIVVAGMAVLIFVAFRYKNKFRRYKVFSKIFDFTAGIFEGSKTIFHMKKFPEFLLHTVIIWICYFLMTYLLFFSLSKTSSLSPIDGLFILVIGGLGMSAPVQGGIGAFHWIVSLALSMYVTSHGITKDDGLVYATISHTSQMLFVIALGIFSLIMLFLASKRKTVK